MTMMKPTLRVAAPLAAALLASLPLHAGAKVITVEMKNSGAEGPMVFEPSFVKANVGDVVQFVPTHLSHNAESIAGMTPPGATPFKGAMNKPVSFTVQKPGLYGIKCAPHFGMGMVALVQAGKVMPADLAAAQTLKLPGMAKKRMTAALAKVR